MVTERKVEEDCPRCDPTDDVWMFVKPEGAFQKNCYSCDSCGAEWSEVVPEQTGEGRARSTPY